MKKGWCKDMSEETKTGYWKRGTRAKAGAYATIDNITKFALDDSDYEYYEEWVEYTEEELAQMAAQEEAALKKAEQEEFLNQAPTRMTTVENYISALTSAFGEVN